MPSKPLRISDLGEKRVIRRLIDLNLEFQPESSLFFDYNYFKSLSDDAALIDFDEKYLVVTSDMLIESSHLPKEMTPFQKGSKVVTVNISDLAAMGARPIGFILSMGLTGELLVSEFDEIIAGVLQSCQNYELSLVGGDINKSKELILCGTCFGVVDKDKVLMKSGARPGDVVAITGPLGVAAAGFEVIFGSPSLKKSLKPATKEYVLKYALEPRARLNKGILLAKTGVVTSATDITDGLASEVGELIDASEKNVGITLYEKMIPLIPEVREIATIVGKKPLDLALYYGEDFELLLTIRKEDYDHLKDKFTLQQVGVVTSSGRVEIVDKEGNTKILEPKGYQHFK